MHRSWLTIYVISAFFSFISLVAYSQAKLPADIYDKLCNEGLIDVSTLDSSIRVQLMYATEDNFLKQNVYGSLTSAFLQPEVARKLVKAQQELRKSHPLYSLIVYDAARPRSVQAKMWEVVKNTPSKAYVASPGRISMHSYGVAVDVSVVDAAGVPLDMGTPFDFFGKQAEPRHEAAFLASGELTQKQLDNRKLLRAAMRKAGFRSIQNEWWHFEAYTREEAKTRYKPID